MRKSNRRVSVCVRIGLVFVTLCIFGLLSSYRDGQIRGAEKRQPTYRVWLSQPPADCPFPKSTDITGIGFTGRQIHYANADTWYPSWAANGNLYSPWTDGTVNNTESGSGGTEATTGYATVIGDDPLHLKITERRRLSWQPGPV